MAVKLLSSSSGSVTLDVPVTASNFALTLPAANGTVITTSNPQSGSVLQVVQTTYSTETDSTTTSYVDTGITATITPKFASSKIMIFITGQAYKGNGNASNSLSLKVQKNGSNLYFFGDLFLYTATATELSGIFSSTYLDSPATTSATTYKVQFKNSFVSASLVRVQFQSMPSVITLMEIAA